MANIYRRQLLMMAWLSLSLDAVLTACGSVSLDQGVVLENERREAIHDIQIIYGTVNIPRRPRTLGAKAGYEHDARMVVPGTAKVVWRTEDTTVHAVDVPLRGQIPYPSHFAGRLVFQFHDEALRVILMQRTRPGPWDHKRIY